MSFLAGDPPERRKIVAKNELCLGKKDLVGKSEGD
jgi:hypothetical protein